MEIKNGRQGIKNKYYLQLVDDFSKWLTRLNYAEQTVKSRKRHLEIFLEWIEQKGVNQLQDISRKDIEDYSEATHKRPIKTTTIEAYLSVLKLLNEYLESYGQAPVVKVKLSVEQDIKVERIILTKEEVNRLYEACENTIWGMRDRVILAVFYGCGLRCREGTNLELSDVDFSDGLLHVRKGKNYKERYVPMSNGVMKIIGSWIEEGQGIFSSNKTLLLPSIRGKITDGGSLNKRLKMLCESAEVDKHITLHCLRHSIATHLLESGMDLESISQFLGHQGMEATKIYTRIIDQIDEGI